MAEITEEVKAKVLEEATSVTPDYSIDYNDPRFSQATESVDQSKSEYNQLMDGMIEGTDSFYDALKENSQNWADTQSQLQQERTDFTIEQIEQQKDQAHKDYLKEQSGSYVDWQKQSNQYGANAEKMASAGLAGTGYSESSQVSMYNTYQNRVATARESYQRAVLNYDNAIKDAQLQNNAALAEIAYNALQQQLELGLQGFQYKNQLIIDKANKNIEFDNTKWNRYQDVLNQINTENALKEEVRQFDTKLEFDRTENEKDREFQLKRDELDREFQAKENELNRKHDIALQNAKTKAEKELLEIQHKQDLEKLKKQYDYDVGLLTKEYDLKKKNNLIDDGGGGIDISGYTGIKATVSGENGKDSTSNILELGYGPISPSKLGEKINTGEVDVAKDENGNLTFSKAKKSTKKAITLPTWNLGK